jgi:hypothetical protein
MVSVQRRKESASSTPIASKKSDVAGAVLQEAEEII